MKTLYTLLLLFVFTLASGQNTKYQFAKDVFKKEYKEQTYEPYKGKVAVVDSTTINMVSRCLLYLHGKRSTEVFLLIMPTYLLMTM